MASHDDVENGTSTQSAAMSLEKHQTDIKLTDEEVDDNPIEQAFYARPLNPVAAMLLAQTTQLLGYGWAGLFRKYLVDSPYMWWPANLVQVSLFRALHEKEKRPKGGLSRLQFFLMPSLMEKTFGKCGNEQRVQLEISLEIHNKPATRPLYENPTEIHVHCSASRNNTCFNNLLRHSLVASNIY
ncbi:hypothetical protein Q3G72_000850 [Acer saccharum]|nr:hypothetical protein Q3G72_000850 [Acer saccharum]